MTIEEHNEVLRSRLSLALEHGFVLKAHHYMARDRDTGEMFGYETIIFDHDFAKAIWSEDPIDPTGPQINTQVTEISLDDGNQKNYTYDENKRAKDMLLNPDRFISMYIYHIQLMAAAEDRLAYLGANT